MAEAVRWRAMVLAILSAQHHRDPESSRPACNTQSWLKSWLDTVSSWLFDQLRPFEELASHIENEVDGTGLNDRHPDGVFRWHLESRCPLNVSTMTEAPP